MNPPPDHCLGGRLRHFLPFWRTICSDHKVLDYIKGVQFEFTQQVTQKKFPKPIHMSTEQIEFMDNKIVELVANGSIKKIDKPPKQGWISNVFLVPKKDQGFRMILNLKPLNKFIKYEKFKMDHISNVITLLRPNMVLTSLDISSAFSHLYVLPCHQPYLIFKWKDHYYQFICLPQGATCSPRIFVRVTSPIMKFKRRRLVTIVIYIDDTLLIVNTIAEMKHNLQLTIDTLTKAGFLINFHKSQLELTTCIEFLGFILDTVQFTRSLSSRKLHSLERLILHAVVCRKVTIHKLSRIIGKIVATFPCCEKAPLHYRVLDRFKVRMLKLKHNRWPTVIHLNNSSL